tara:strand:- start:354 stop:617 length:264 start_codon:yes stop_codon:yes gene_type:complete
MQVILPYAVDSNSTTVSDVNLIVYPYLVSKKESYTMSHEDIILRLEAALYDKDWDAIELLLEDLKVDDEQESLDQGYDQFVNEDYED